MGELVLEARTGNRLAMNRLLRALAPSMLRATRKILGSGNDAEDAVQVALCAVARSVPRIRKPNSVKSFAMTTARREALAIVNRRKLCPSCCEADRRADPRSGPEDACGNKEREQCLRRHIERLPKHHREVVLLQYFEDLTLTEIARVLRIRKGTAKSRSRRAKEALAQSLLKDPYFCELQDKS